MACILYLIYKTLFNIQNFRFTIHDHSAHIPPKRVNNYCILQKETEFVLLIIKVNAYLKPIPTCYNFCVKGI